MNSTAWPNRTRPAAPKSQNSTSALKGIEPIKYWQQKWEHYMLLTNVPYSTRDRYSRVVQALLDHFRDNRYPHSFLRPQLIDYRDKRLKEAKPSTVRLEFTAIRSFWNWMMQMGVVDVLFNPANNIKVPTRPKPSFANPPGDSVVSPSEEGDVSQPGQDKNGDQDPVARGLIAFDGIHPNDSGHKAIADALRALGYGPLK